MLPADSRSNPNNIFIIFSNTSTKPSLPFVMPISYHDTTTPLQTFHPFLSIVMTCSSHFGVPSGDQLYLVIPNHPQNPDAIHQWKVSTEQALATALESILGLVESGRMWWTCGKWGEWGHGVLTEPVTPSMETSMWGGKGVPHSVHARCSHKHGHWTSIDTKIACPPTCGFMSFQVLKITSVHNSTGTYHSLEGLGREGGGDIQMSGKGWCQKTIAALFTDFYYSEFHNI